MMVNGKMVIKMVKEHLLSVQEIFIQEHLKMVKKMEMGLYSMQMDVDMKENGLMIKLKDKES